MTAGKVKAYIKQNWLLYGIGITIIYGIKHFYSAAGSEALSWILAPTAWWAGTLGGIDFIKEPRVGYISQAYRFIIEPACSGVQFMTITMAALIFSYVHRMGTLRRGLCWIGICAGFSYLVTVFVNGFRIAVSIFLPVYMDKYNISVGLSPEKLHTAIGTAIYFISLLVVYQSAGVISRKIARTSAGVPPAGNPIVHVMGRFMPPVFWYLSILLGIPLLTLAYRKDTGKFFEYTKEITAVCLAALFLFCLAYLIRGHYGGKNEKSHGNPPLP